MRHENNEGVLIRRYLLGQVSEDERQQLEERIMTDNELYDRVLLAEDEMVEEYVRGGLSESERAGFEASFLSTAEGRKQVSFEKTLSSYVSSARGSQGPAASHPAGEETAGTTGERARAGKVIRPAWWSRPTVAPYFRMAAAAVIVLGVGLGLWRVFFYPSEVAKGMAALARAYRTERPLEARISGLNYAPYPDTRGIEQIRVDDTSLDRAERILLDEVAERPSPEAHHALGRFYLAEQQFDKARTQFQEALAVDPKNAQLHSDLGVALLEQGRTIRASGQDGHVDAFARSLEHLNRALVLNPSLHEALFDRALLHEQMTLVQLALEDWHAYLERDSSSPWADEAREHRDRLQEEQRKIGQRQQTVVEDFLHAYRDGDAAEAWTHFSLNREKLMTQLIDDYLKSASRPTDNSLNEALAALAYAGEIESQHTGDHYAADLARFYGSASSHQLARTGEARDLMVQAQTFYESTNVREAAAAYDDARQRFMRAGDLSGAHLAKFWMGLCYWELMQTDRSRELWTALLQSCKQNRHRWLEARTLNMLSGVEFKYDEYSRAIAYSSNAWKLARDLEDVSGAFSASSALIEYYRLVGNREECMAQVGRGMPTRGNTTLSRFALWRYYDLVATAHATFEQYDAAIACEREALSLAADADDFVLLSLSNANLGLMYGKAREFGPAFQHTEQAYEIAAQHAAEPAGQLQMAFATVARGHLHRERGEFDRALTYYDQGIRLHRVNNLDFSIHLYQAYKGRLACLIAVQDTEAARQQFAVLLTMMDKQRSAIVEEENRNNFFAVEQSVYDMGIDFAYTQMHNWSQAFAWAEDSRARSLLDSMSASAQVTRRGGKRDLQRQAAVQPMPLGEIQVRIPDNARLLYYSVLDDKLLIWVVSRSEARVVKVQISQSALTDIVIRYCSAIARSESEANLDESGLLARELFGYLIGPIEKLLYGSDFLYIVPDKILNRLPWDALISPTSDRFVVHDYTVTVSPSATLFAICTDLADQRVGPRAEHVAAVGNPTFDPTVFRKLKPLTDAAHEVASIRDLYPFGSILVGAAAREQAVREALSRADVAHFALHCVVNERSPMRSTLVLAKEPPGGSDSQTADGLLQASEIYDMKLPRMRLSVLSACQSGVERYYRGEGMIGMARAFLVAQVPLVVASLWPVDDRATQELMIRLHEYRKRGGRSTGEALRLAKRDLLEESRYRQPAFWAAFQAIGGHASF